MKLAQAIVQGLEVGGFYAVLASGLTLIFGIMNVVNVAHGALLVLAGLVTFELWRTTGIDPLLTIPLTTPVMFAAGWVLYRTLVRRVRGAPASMSVLLTFALALAIEGVMVMVWKNVFRSVTPSYVTQAFHIGGLTVGKVDLYGFAVAVAVLALMYLLLTRTWMGRAIRSTMENPQGAQLVGVRVGDVSAFAFALGVATVGAAGAILALRQPIFPASHYIWISRGLGIIVLGGMGSLPGALVGALVLGVAETVTTTYLSARWSPVMFYVAIMVVLLVRPHGLLGERLREDVAQ
ncbi:MAG TPA: branched-chain amino acid ABC transporter permease [Actinomycetes bacterium]|jgi:branched-chain amino acid transport system permease protein|nr:branched-chain amino acid ABC transporter permease [Actinomycetes bacterium]